MSAASLPDGAVLLPDGPDAGALWHCGAPLREQRALLAGEAWVDLSHRDVVRVEGKDMRTWLHAITSQAFTSVDEHELLDALVLDAQGRIRFAVEGIVDGDVFTCHTEPGHGADLAAFLTSMVFASRVAVSEPDLAVVELARDGARLERVLLPREAVGELVGERAQVGMWASEACRIADGRPRWLLDTDERTIPNELGLFGTALDKGCYPGQETVGRVHTLGRPPRRLVRLSLDGTQDHLPPAGADIMLDGRVVGRVGSSALHLEEGPIALGLLKRSTPTDATVTVDGVPATQEALVDPDVGLHVRPRL